MQVLKVVVIVAMVVVPWEVTMAVRLAVRMAVRMVVRMAVWVGGRAVGGMVGVHDDQQSGGSCALRMGHVTMRMQLSP